MGSTSPRMQDVVWPGSVYQHRRTARDPQGMAVLHGMSITMRWLGAVVAAAGRGDWVGAEKWLARISDEAFPSRQREAAIVFADLHLGIGEPERRVAVFRAVTACAEATGDADLLEQRLSRSMALAEVLDDEWVAAAVRMEMLKSSRAITR